MENDRFRARVEADGGELTCLQGAIAINLRDAMAEICGPDAMSEARALLPPAVRRELDDALSISWVPLRSVEYLVHALSDVTRRDAYQLNREANRLASERTFTTIWRVMLRLASVELLFARAQRYYARAYDRGTLTAQVTFPGRGDIRVRGRSGMSRLAREGFGIGVETLVRVSGRTDARIRGEPHPDGADYILLWRA